MASVRKQPIRILLAGFHEVVRAGLREFIGTRSMEIVGESQTVSQTLAAASLLKPDVVLMEVLLSDGCGLKVCHKILVENPAIHVLFLTAVDEDEVRISSIFAGADGYLLKNIGSTAMLDAIESVVSEVEIPAPSIFPPLLKKIRNSPLPPICDRGLSPQESRILFLVAEGKTNKEIGEALGLSDKTVKNYLSTVFQKLNVSRRSQAAVLFTQIISN